MGLISRSFLDPAGDPAKGSTQKPSYGLNSPSTMRKRPGGCGGSEVTPQEGRRDVPGLCAWGILPQPPGGLVRRLCMSRCPSRSGGDSVGEFPPAVDYPEPGQDGVNRGAVI